MSSPFDAYISIGIPTYNSSRYLKACIKSVINLKKVNQIIISDDCSKESELNNIEKIIQEFKNKTSKDIVFLKNNKNLGAYINKLNLIKESSNNFIYILDSDNIAGKNLDTIIHKVLSTENAEKYLFQPNTMYQFWKYHKFAKFFSRFRNKFIVRFYKKNKIIDLNYVRDSLILNSGEYKLDNFIENNEELISSLEKDTLIDKWIFWILNCGNFIVSKKLMIEIGNSGLNIDRKLRSVDAIVFSYLWLNSELEINILKDFYHHHRKRDDSVSFSEKEDSKNAIRYYIKEVLKSK